MPWPTNDDTGNAGAIGREPADHRAGRDLRAGLAGHTFHLEAGAGLDPVPAGLAERGHVAGQEARRAHRPNQSQLFTIGTGTNQPDGIVTSATIGVTGAGSLATTGGISYDNLVDLMESLDPAYGDHPDARWMMHQTIRKAIRKLKDTTGKPIWEPSVQVGVPDTLLGRAVRVNNDMASVAQEQRSAGLRQHQAAYVVREVIGSSALLRLTERYADNLQVGFIAFERSDGTLRTRTPSDVQDHPDRLGMGRVPDGSPEPSGTSPELSSHQPQLYPLGHGRYGLGRLLLSAPEIPPARRQPDPPRPTSEGRRACRHGWTSPWSRASSATPTPTTSQPSGGHQPRL